VAGAGDARHLRGRAALDRGAKESHRGPGQEGSRCLLGSTDGSEGSHSEGHRQHERGGCYQFIAVIDSCSTVAIDTHTRYGTWATATHLQCGQTAATHQTSEAHTITMSTQASGMSRSPAKIGMNSRFATRLMAKGTATSSG